MTREIKFRQWYDGKMRILDQRFIGVGQIGFSDTHYTDLNADDQEDSVVMQFTGIKDMRQRDIYEGDILLQHANRTKFVVKWIGDSPVRVGWNIRPAEKQEIVGNIYENSELIK